MAAGAAGRQAHLARADGDDGAVLRPDDAPVRQRHQGAVSLALGNRPGRHHQPAAAQPAEDAGRPHLPPERRGHLGGGERLVLGLGADDGVAGFLEGEGEALLGDPRARQRLIGAGGIPEHALLHQEEHAQLTRLGARELERAQSLVQRRPVHQGLEANLDDPPGGVRRHVKHPVTADVLAAGGEDRPLDLAPVAREPLFPHSLAHRA